MLGHGSEQIGARFASLNRSLKGAFMTIDLTRRTLLHLAGASSLTAAAIAAAQAEGTAGGTGGPTFANRTPMRIGMVTLRVRDLDKVDRLLS